MTVPKSDWTTTEPTDQAGGMERVPEDGPTPGIRAVPPPVDDPDRSHPGFGGTFTTDDAVLVGSLEFEGDRLIMWGGGAILLSWGPDGCLLERLTANRFVLSAAGETITFTADDPDALEAASQYQLYASPRPQLSSTPAPAWRPELTLAVDHVSEAAEREETATASALEAPAPAPQPTNPELDSSSGPGRRPFVKAVRPLRPVEDVEEAASEGPEEPLEPEHASHTIADFAVTRARGARNMTARRWLSGDIHAIAIKVGMVSGAVVVVTGFAFGIVLLMGGLSARAPDDPAQSPTTSIVTVHTTATSIVPPVDTVPLTTSVFELAGADFSERWNLLASGLDESLLLSPNLTSPFALALNANITFDGILDPVNGNLRLRAAPTATPEGDRAILVSLALVIGTAEPSLTPSQRGQLLEELGLDPRHPELAGLDGARTYNGRLYELVYLSDEGVLQLTVRPEAAATITTTSTTTG